MESGKRQRRNNVVFLVEGRSDRAALRYHVSRLYNQIDESIDVDFLIMLEQADKEKNEKEKEPKDGDKREQEGGDITSMNTYTDECSREHKIKPDNIPNHIGDMFYNLYLREHVKRSGNMLKDIVKIIQIVDTDGAFISDDNVVSDQNCTKPFYAENEIRCKNAKKIKERNDHKCQILEYLSGLDKIKIKNKTIDYLIYYFSCNLDHFIHDSANFDVDKKCSAARDFSHDKDTSDFEKFFLDDPAAVHGMDYKESWEYIKQGNNSLQRHTNFNLLLKELREKIEKKPKEE